MLIYVFVSTLLMTHKITGEDFDRAVNVFNNWKLLIIFLPIFPTDLMWC